MGGGSAANSNTSTEEKSRKTLIYLTGLVVAMVGCSYAAVPLYRRFCQATGYGGTVQRREVFSSFYSLWSHFLIVPALFLCLFVCVNWILALTSVFSCVLFVIYRVSKRRLLGMLKMELLPQGVFLSSFWVLTLFWLLVLLRCFCHNFSFLRLFYWILMLWK